MDFKSRMNLNVVNAPMSGIRKIADSVASMPDVIIIRYQNLTQEIL